MPAVSLHRSIPTLHTISVLVVFISQMLQITEMNKVVYDMSQDTFKDHLETATVGEQEGHGWELVRKTKKWREWCFVEKAGGGR